MKHEMEPNLQGSDRYKVSIQVLRQGTREIISSLLNPEKILKSEKGFSRCWQGLADLCGVSGEKSPSLRAEKDQCLKILELWYNSAKDEATVEKFLNFLEDLDRYDVIDDIRESLDADIEYHKKHPKAVEAFNVSADHDMLTIDDIEIYNQGIPGYQNYDAFVLFDEADIDFATELITKMENEYGFKLCTKQRDLMGGTLELDAIIRLIDERCFRLIVIVSRSFLNSNAIKFFYNFAQAISIENRHRKIIPCVNTKIDYELPEKIRIYHLLDLSRADGLYNFWEKLSSSIKAPAVQNCPQTRTIVNGLERSSSASRCDSSSTRTELLHEGSNCINKPLNQTLKFKSTSNIAESTCEELLPEISNSPRTSCNSLDDRNLVPPKKRWYKKVKKLIPGYSEKTKKVIEGECQDTTASVGTEKHNGTAPSTGEMELQISDVQKKSSDERNLEDHAKEKSLYNHFISLIIPKIRETNKKDESAAVVTIKQKKSKKKKVAVPN